LPNSFLHECDGAENPSLLKGWDGVGKPS